jgi:hypothetical protein
MIAPKLVISGYHQNELLSVNTLHDRKLCTMSRTSDQSLFQCVMSLLSVL